MLKWLALSLSLGYVPLPILDARITAYHKQLSLTNLTVADRLALTKQMREDMLARYKILEDIEEPDETN